MAPIPARPARRGATQPAAPTRLPSTRERKPAVAALGVLLILGGALASGYLALQAGNRDQYLVVSSQMVQGTEFTEDDVEVVDLPEGMQDVVPADEKDAVVGTFASVPLLPGTILTPDMYSTVAGGKPGYNTVTVEVPAGDVAAQAASGAPLLAYRTGEDQAAEKPVPVYMVSVADVGDDGPGSSDSVFINVSVQSGDCAQAVATAGEELKVVTGTDADAEDCGAVQDTTPSSGATPTSSATPTSDDGSSAGAEKGQ